VILGESSNVNEGEGERAAFGLQNVAKQAALSLSTTSDYHGHYI